MSNQQLNFKEKSAHFNESVYSLCDEVMKLVLQAERPGIAIGALTLSLANIISGFYSDNTQQTLRLIVGDLGRLVEECRKMNAREATTTEGAND